MPEASIMHSHQQGSQRLSILPGPFRPEVKNRRQPLRLYPEFAMPQQRGSGPRHRLVGSELLKVTLPIRVLIVLEDRRVPDLDASETHHSALWSHQAFFTPSFDLNTFTTCGPDSITSANSVRAM